MNKTLPNTVHEIGQIHFVGNIIPHKWFQHVKMPSGSVDTTGIILLADIVYWYRPTEHIPRKKFKADMLQASASYFHTKFGFTKKQVRDALKRLEDAQYIRREYRKIKTKDGITLNNVMFIEPVPQKILEITPQDDRDSNELKWMPYNEYLQTPEWKARRKERLKNAGHRCQVCNSPKQLNVHHRTYERRGEELPQDLVVLCRNCHSTFHDASELYEG